MIVLQAGSLSFGLVVGWITYRSLRRREGNASLSDISAVIGAVGGAAVTGLFPESAVFGTYCIGLAVGFFGYLVVGLKRGSQGDDEDWMGDR